MEAFFVPGLAAAFTWWASTGILFWLVGRPRATHWTTAMGATALMGLSMMAVLWLRDMTGPAAAYLGFAAGIAIWAWHETLFLLGFVSGPRRTPCPPGLTAWQRFRVSTEVVIHHELAIAVHGVVLIALCWDAQNAVALWTFLLLWGMRLNAKFVVFLGAPNLSDSFIPDHLTYLSTYFGKRRVTAWFPLFITLATAAATALTYTSLLHTPGTVTAIGLMLVAALAWLAVFEHWALVLPIPDEALWRWARPAHPTPASKTLRQEKTGDSHGL